VAEAVFAFLEFRRGLTYVLVDQHVPSSVADLLLPITPDSDLCAWHRSEESKHDVNAASADPVPIPTQVVRAEV
jgi:hypothetical protein